MSCPKISVIMPIFNVEKYLVNCLDSILNQTIVEDIEVIMIDDGSSDESRYIIERYALDYDNFHAYHKENEGLTIARNVGVDLAKGNYIHFMDADDFLMPDAYEKLYNFAVENDNDFVVCSDMKYSEINIWKDIIFKNAFKNVNEDIPSTTLNKSPFLVWDTLSTNKLYKKQFLKDNDLRFLRDKIYYEDIIFSFMAYHAADSIGVINDDFYFWRLREDNSSITQGISDVVNFQSRFYILNQIHEFMVENIDDENIINTVYLKWLSHDFTIYMKRINDLPNKYRHELMGFLQGFLKFIPDELILQLNGYYQVLYQFVKTDDMENLIEYSKINPDVIQHIEWHEFYRNYKDKVDFGSAFEYEELIAELQDLKKKNNNLLIDVDFYINYVAKNDADQISFKLEKDSTDYDLDYDIIDNTYRITVPVEMIDSVYSKIKILYVRGDVEKTTYIRTHKRYVRRFGNIDVNLLRTFNKELVLYSRVTNENEILIDRADFDGEYLILKGTSAEQFKTVFVEHLIDFDRKTYDVEFEDNINFTFKIPYVDIINKHIRKWEIRPEGSFKSISTLNFQFYEGINQIKFHNQRDIIVVNIKFFKAADLLYFYKSEIQSLRQEVIDLEEKCSAFKSRKIVKFADKFRIGK